MTQGSVPAEERFKRIRTATIRAIFSDELLTQKLVLKGGNLLDLVYGVSARSSLDIDFSMEDEFEPGDTARIAGRIRRALEKTFRESGYRVFDFAFHDRPKKTTKETRANWGGYLVEFKLIEVSRFRKISRKISVLRRNAAVIGIGQRKTFKIDISKYEFCSGKDKAELDGITIFIYTPLMMIFEKLRAICQQFPEYCEAIQTHPPSARARDFVDIYMISESFRIDWRAEGNRDMIIKIFATKRVPISYLERIGEHREFHRQEFELVKATVYPGYELKEFDFYVDYVTDRCKELETARII